MSRRARAAGFASVAAICAGLAAGATGDGGASISGELGPLREVAVATAPIPAGARLTPKLLERSFEVRRVPERFLAPEAIPDPRAAAGRRVAAAIPAGGYLLEGLLRAAGAAPKQPAAAPHGAHPVEIAVTGAGATALGGAGGRRVDVVVTTEPGPGGGAGRTYVAAEAVPLLELRAPREPGASPALAGDGGEPSIATLALSRAQALRLIQAESFARSVRLIPR